LGQRNIGGTFHLADTRKETDLSQNVLKMGIVGMTSDHIWRSMGPNLAALPAVDLVTGAEPYQELRDRAVARFGLQSVYEDYRDMFANEELDAIVVCSDSGAKADIVEESAAHGVHVYLDKPMSATLAQADRIVAAAEGSGIKVMVAYHAYFSAATGRIQQWLNDGMIGQVYLGRAMAGHGGPREFGCSEYFCEWLFDKDKNGGGAFVDVGCYSVSTMLDHLGGVEEVSAFTTQMGIRDYLPPGVEDNSVAILRFKSGAMGVIDAKWGQVGRMPMRSSYHGTEGTILMTSGGISLYSTRVLPDDLQGWVEIPMGREPRPGIGTEAAHFVNQVLADAPFEGAVSLRGARATQEVIEAVYRSAETGKVVKLPL
jgi:predicted dehydrogenase